MIMAIFCGFSYLYDIMKYSMYASQEPHNALVEE